MRLPGIALAIAFLLSFVAVACAEAPSMMIENLPTLKDYKAMRNSSADPDWKNGNGDARGIEPGRTLTLAELEGPGRITHIWFTIASNERDYGKKLTLKMYWDGESAPSVESPMNDFFCQGHGLDAKVQSLPFRVTSEGRARNCYFPMPFRKSAKIQVTNDGKEWVGALYYYIDWQKTKGLPEDTAYFHAKYRQEYPCKSGEDYLILDAAGKGHYVGCNLSIHQREPGWFGEGDDRFYIDGEAEPSLRGTGTEDYFCDAWGIRVLEGLYYGCTIQEGLDTFDRTTAYRFHIPDPVPFDKSLKVTIEHKGARLQPDGNWNGYLERADDYSSVAYWYQIEPHKEFFKLPAAEGRLYPVHASVIEAETLIGNAEVEGPKPGAQAGGWSGGSQLFFTPDSDKASLTLKFRVEKDAAYRVRLFLTKSWDYGIYSAYLDGNQVGSAFDLYAPNVAVGLPHSFGFVNLTKGEHTLKFQCSGKNVASKGYFFGLDSIELTSL